MFEQLKMKYGLQLNSKGDLNLQKLRGTQFNTNLLILNRIIFKKHCYVFTSLP